MKNAKRGAQGITWCLTSWPVGGHVWPIITCALTRRRKRDKKENSYLGRTICIHPPNNSLSQQALADASVGLSSVILS